MDRSSVQAWLDRYSHAWETYDTAEIGSLFSEDAVYSYHPYDDGDDVERGREAIVSSWVSPDGSASSRDAAGTYEGRYEPFAVDGDRAVAVGTSTYWTDATRSTIRTVYHNAYLLDFDPDGRCRSFTDFFMERPKAK
jgi:SnoaL-like domain